MGARGERCLLLLLLLILLLIYYYLQRWEYTTKTTWSRRKGRTEGSKSGRKGSSAITIFLVPDTDTSHR